MLTISKYGSLAIGCRSMPYASAASSQCVQLTHSAGSADWRSSRPKSGNASGTAGSPAADAQTQAAARGYDVVPGGEGRVLLKVPQLAPQVPSKRGCDLRVGPTGRVVSAAYSDSL